MSHNIAHLLTRAQAKAAGLTVRVTKPVPTLHAEAQLGPMLRDAQQNGRKAALVLIKGSPKTGLAEVWSAKPPKVQHVSMRDYGDFEGNTAGPFAPRRTVGGKKYNRPNVTGWSKNGRPRPLADL